MRDSLHNLTFKNALPPPAAAIADNTASVGVWIDRSGYESLTFGILTGNLADADATFAVLMEDANASDKSDAAAVTDDNMLSQTPGIAPEVAAGFTFANDNVASKLGYIGGKRFARITVTPSGNTGNAPLAAMAVLGNAATRPAA